MLSDTYLITFPETTDDQRNRWAASLADALRGIDPSLHVDRVRTNPDAQDFGASLAIALGTASATAIAKGIAAWIARQPGRAVIEISKDGKVRASGIDSPDAARIAEAFAKRT